jgi:hypothetical protein
MAMTVTAPRKSCNTQLPHGGEGGIWAQKKDPLPRQNPAQAADEVDARALSSLSFWLWPWAVFRALLGA